jgi:hypothetical protein
MVIFAISVQEPAWAELFPAYFSLPAISLSCARSRGAA